MYGLTFIQNVNSHISFFSFVILVSDVVVHPSIALEGVHWAKDVQSLLVRFTGAM
jgi:hypothetical protein